MNDKPEPAIYINVDLDRDTLAVVVTVFEKMIEDPEAIDGSMYDLTPFGEFELLAKKLKALSETAQASVKIPMTFSEWVTYSSYASHVYDLEDDLTPEEETVIGRVNATISEILIKNGRV